MQSEQYASVRRGETAVMEDGARTLVILLTMHRCGSSLTTRVLQRLGMSLGPFELNGAAPSNPYGHFESVPFLLLNQRIQKRVFGFGDDVPESDEVMARFLLSRGEWSDEITIPEEWYTEGRLLIRGLLDSGMVSGFKDPRTVLTWPFWKRVLDDFPDVRVIPVGLTRSPHEIAMSLVSRREGCCGYWTALDIVAVHFRRQLAILQSLQSELPCACFGGPGYLEILEIIARECGLGWDRDAVEQCVDLSCRHHLPATVTHESQSLFGALVARDLPPGDVEFERVQIESDARLVEALRLRQLRVLTEDLAIARQHVEQSERKSRDLQEQVVDALRQLATTQSRWIDEDRKLHEMLDVQSRQLESLHHQLAESHWRERVLTRDSQHLEKRLLKIESHPLLGPVVRARRGIFRLMKSMFSGVEL